VIKRYRDRDIPKYFRGDAAFAIPALYQLLEAEGFAYAIRIPANDVLTARISHLLTRPVGRPSHKPKIFYESFWYQAQSWHQAHRIMAKVEWHRGELFPRVGFIVTNMTGWSRTVVQFYNGRATAEQWIKEGKYAVKWARLSCRSFEDNQTRLQLFALAYNLGNFLRRLVLRGSACPVRDVPVGRGGRAAGIVCGDPRPHPAVRRAAAVDAALLSGATWRRAYGFHRKNCWGCAETRKHP
jgi:hypothetical protein